MAGNEGAAGYPWQALRDSNEFIVVDFDATGAGLRPFWNSGGSPPFVPTPVFMQFMFERQGNVSYSPWVSIPVSGMVIPTPSVANTVDVTLIFHTLPGVTFQVRQVNL